MKKQLPLKEFSNEYSIPYTTLMRWIRSKRFYPAYKICGRWYVDIEDYRKWRNEEQVKLSYA